jgi:hypothetical protein
MPLPEFKDEKEFREKWIGPFLSRMGYILPKHVHGQDEQGKDFFFVDHDRFGHLRIYSAQAKLGNIGTGPELTQLLDQIERSFEITLKYHKGAHEQRIAAVYVMTTGTTSHQARERIWERCRQRSYGENVFFLDGDVLENLERHAAYEQDTQLRQRLIALVKEASFNIATPLKFLIESCQKGAPRVFVHCRMLALEGVLMLSLPETIIPYSTLSNAWNHMTEINKWAGPMKMPSDAKNIESTLGIAQGAININNQICVACNEAIRALDERYSLTFEVVKTT